MVVIAAVWPHPLSRRSGNILSLKYFLCEAPSCTDQQVKHAESGNRIGSKGFQACIVREHLGQTAERVAMRVAWHGKGRASASAAALAGALACVLAMPPAAHADSGPEPVDPAMSQACADMAADFADQDTPRGPDAGDVAAAGIDGAIIGGLAGRDRFGTGWSPGGAARGARTGGGIAALEGLGRVDEQAWQAAFDRAYAACMAGKPRPLTRRERCRSTGVVVGSGQQGGVGVSSRRDCD